MGEIVLSENKGEEIPKILEERETDFQIEKIEIYKRMNRLAEAGGILFAGSSLMENFPIYEFAQGRISKKLYNRGVGGYTMADFIRHIIRSSLTFLPKKCSLISAQTICPEQNIL